MLPTGADPSVVPLNGCAVKVSLPRAMTAAINAHPQKPARRMRRNPVRNEPIFSCQSGFFQIAWPLLHSNHLALTGPADLLNRRIKQVKAPKSGEALPWAGTAPVAANNRVAASKRVRWIFMVFWFEFLDNTGPPGRTNSHPAASRSQQKDDCKFSQNEFQSMP